MCMGPFTVCIHLSFLMSSLQQSTLHLGVLNVSKVLRFPTDVQEIQNDCSCESVFSFSSFLLHVSNGSHLSTQMETLYIHSKT